MDTAAEKSFLRGIVPGFGAVGKLRAIGEQLAKLQPARAPATFAITLHADGLSLASLARTPAPERAARPYLSRCEFHRLSRDAEPGLALRSLLLAAGMERASFRLVLNADEYQLHRVESPEVPAAELRDALRWRVRDLIDFPVEEAAIDAFDLPARALPGGPRTLCVVVSRAELIARKAALISRGGSELDLIDIPELALRNLLALNGADERGVALHYAEAEHSLIVICAGGALYLSRRIGIGLKGLAAGGEDSLALELLRSLEYYESHFARPPVETLLVAPAGAVAENLQRHFAKTLSLPTRELDLNALFETAAWLTPEQQARNLLAVGAALRQDRPTL